MVAPSFWVDPKTGNSYMLTVQYPESQIQTLTDFRQIPLRSANGANTTPLESVADIPDNQYTYGSRSLPASPRVRHLRHAEEGRSEPG